MSVVESVRRSRARPTWSALAFLAICLALAVPATATEKSDKSKNLTTQDKARQLREASEARATRNLGYATVLPTDPSPPIDYYALGMMMARLSQTMQGMNAGVGAMSRADGASAGLGSFMGAGPAPAYGPDGPTEKSVKLILEYRLMLAGNPRLQVGGVADKGETIHATVVTKDGSLVEEYDVNKTTGVWVPVRKDK
jgi:hypothetical protein